MAFVAVTHIPRFLKHMTLRALWTARRDNTQLQSCEILHVKLVHVLEMYIYKTALSLPSSKIQEHYIPKYARELVMFLDHLTCKIDGHVTIPGSG